MLSYNAIKKIIFIPNVSSMLKSISDGGGESQRGSSVSASMSCITGDGGGDSSPVSNNSWLSVAPEIQQSVSYICKIFQ